MTALLDATGDPLDIIVRRGSDLVVEIECYTDRAKTVPADLTGYTADGSAIAPGKSAVTIDASVASNIVSLSISRTTLASMTASEWSYAVFTNFAGKRYPFVYGRLVLKSEFAG